MFVNEPSLAALIREEIEQSGPIPFERFMNLALYAPGRGYYVRGRDPFGVRGDFYTAEQMQPVFGILVAQFIASLRRGTATEMAVVELGAGRGEMAEALRRFSYTPVDVQSTLPAEIDGVVFANEFFDALPVGLAVRRRRQFHDVLVTTDDGRFRFVDGSPCLSRTREYLKRFYKEAASGDVVEIHLRGLDWLDRIAETLRGWLLVIDYGYTAREFVRFRGGTLMSYRRHSASSDVLSCPGDQDITSHIPWTVFREHLEQRGWAIGSFETLASFLLRAGEPDQFAAALTAASEAESLKRRMQLKTLLYGMGETFRVLVAKSPAR